MPMVPTLPIRCNTCGSGEATAVASCRDFEYETCDNEFTFVSCDQCGLIYLRNRPAVSSLQTIYPREYLPYHFHEKKRSIVGQLRARVLKRKVGLVRDYAPEGAFIVDVGCGSGELLRLLRDHGDPSWHLVGVDFADQAVRAVERLNLRCEQQRFEEMVWEGPAPHVVILNQVIEHLENPRAAVKKAYDLLAPEGILLVETPSVDAWDAKWFWRRHWGGWHAPRHWTLYSEETLRSLLVGQGFRLVETKYLLSPNFWLQSLHHYFIDRWSQRRIASLFNVEVLPSLAAATGLDILQIGLHGKTSNLRMVAQKPVSSTMSLNRLTSDLHRGSSSESALDVEERSRRIARSSNGGHRRENHDGGNGAY